jgi:mono/diheme cytochrome c family protein
MKWFLLPLVLVVLSWALASCTKAPGPDIPPAGSVQALAEGTALFEKRCFVCHGREGKGDGPTSKGAAIKPRDLSDPTWQNSTSDEQILKVIRNGGLAVGKSAGMPPNLDLTDAQVQTLCLFIRSLGPK